MSNKIAGKYAKGLYYNDNPIKAFTAKCSKCGSENVSIDYVFTYYGGATGYDISLDINCRDCKHLEDLQI